ncbi:hypothetical protein EJB05_18417, partial [Eragrostis curvula]
MMRLQGQLDGASLENELDRLIFPYVDPLFLTMNQSHTIEGSKDRGAPQLDAGMTTFCTAGHMMNSEDYYGVEVISDVYGFPIGQDDRSGVLVQISNVGDGRKSNRNEIVVGWHVHPGLYGDSKTHFYVLWTRDGYESTCSFNLLRPGYVPESNIMMAPGVTIDVVSDPDGIKRTIIFKVLKDSAGDWLVHIGFDSEPYLIGRFPKSLFTSLGDKADNIQIGGFVVTTTTQWAPMGSGFLSNNVKAASFSNIQLIDQNGKKTKVTRGQHPFSSDKNIYSVSPINIEGKFTYGGPLQ